MDFSRLAFESLRLCVAIQISLFVQILPARTRHQSSIADDITMLFTTWFRPLSRHANTWEIIVQYIAEL